MGGYEVPIRGQSPQSRHEGSEIDRHQAFLNHEAVIYSLAKALSQIADALPRVDLSKTLYPTKGMQQAVIELYAYLIRLWIRSYDWYREGSLKHVIHSITRPPELRYKDLIDTIADCSRRIDQLAVVGAQAEQRDMHKKTDVILTKLGQSDVKVLEVKETMICKLYKEVI